MSTKLEVLSLVLGFIGLFGTITATALPTWKVSAFIGANLVVMNDLWQGLWMNCINQANIRMQCKVYESMLILGPELQAARGLMCLSIVLVAISLFITGFGIKKSNCYGDNIKSKNITLAIGGTCYLLSFLTTLIPVSWVGYTVIRNFYNPIVMDSEKHELGSALFIGWASSGILLITGIILLFCYSKSGSKEEEPYTDAPFIAARDIRKKESVYLERTPSSFLERTPSSFHKHQEYV